MPAVSADTLQTIIRLDGLPSYLSGLSAASDALGMFGNASERAERRSVAFGAAAALIGVGLARFTKDAASLQQTEIGFKTLLGSAEAARREIALLQQLAEQTPFEFTALAQGSRRLIGAGQDAENARATILALGNAIAAAGGSTEQFERALEQTAQVMTQGKLQGDELRVLAENGVPMKELMDELGGKSNVSAERFAQALQKVFTSGKYAQAAADQAKSLNGQLSNLRDASTRLSAALGEGLLPPVTAVVKALADFLGWANKLDPAVKRTASTIGVAMVLGLGGYAVSTQVAIARTRALTLEYLANAVAAQKAAGSTARLAGAQLAGTPAGGMKGLPSLGKMGRFGPAALIAGLALDLLPSGNNAMGDVQRVLGGALTGAGLGAFFGPVGAAVGALGGAAYGSYQSTQMAKGGGPSRVETLLEEGNKLLQQQNEKLDSLATGGGADVNLIAGQRQAALAYAHAIGG